MLKVTATLMVVLTAFCAWGKADVLIVADEFPAMQVLANRLKADDGKASQIVDQAHMPQNLAPFEAVVVYIHKELAEPAERAFITYAEGGGRLVLLHHSISSGKRQNRYWFPFLGVKLPAGDVDRGGYKWTEGVTVQWVNLAGNQFIMTNRLVYPEQISYSSSDQSDRRLLQGFTLRETEVYLNHVLDGEHHLLMGLKYTDAETGKTWMQQTAGWMRPAGKGWVIYFMPGHTLHEFENPCYSRILLNAINAELPQIQPSASK